MRVNRIRAWRGAAAACLLLGTMAAPAAARAQGNDAVKKEIQAALDQCAKCLAAKDLEGYSKVWTPDYRLTDPFGESSDREKAIAGLELMVRPADAIQVTSTIEDLQVKGDDATVLVLMKGNARFADPDGKDHKVRWDERSAQIWTKTADGWRQRDNLALTQAIFMDEKPWAPEMRDEEAAARTAIQSNYNAIARALVEKDMETLRKQLPEDLAVYPIRGAKQTRDEFLTMMRAQVEKARPTADYKLERAQVRGDTAVVLATVKTVYTDPRAPGDGKVTTTYYQRDTWKKTDEGWRPVEFRPVYRETVSGGKPEAAIYISPVRS